MVIECSGCGARYRMKPSILKGFHGAEVRCRKCGGKIVIRMSATARGSGPGESVRDRTDGRTGPDPANVPAGGPEGRKDAPPERRKTRWQAAETTSLSPAEEPDPPGAVTENVYSLDRFREARPRKGLTGGFDISGSINPEPALSLEEAEPPEPPPRPLAPPPENREPGPASLLDTPVRWENEGFDASSGEIRPPAAGPRADIEESILRRSPFNASFSNSVSPRPSHVAMVYLFLLFLGGCGYLLIHLLSGLMNGGGK